MLGDNILKIRELKGMSIRSCAKQIGISPGYLSDIEHSIKKNPSIEMLTRIAKVLETPTSELLLDVAVSSLNEIHETVSEYYSSKTNKADIERLQIDAETNLLVNKIKKLSIKERKIVEALVDQFLEEE